MSVIEKRRGKKLQITYFYHGVVVLIKRSISSPLHHSTATFRTEMQIYTTFPLKTFRLTARNGRNRKCWFSEWPVRPQCISVDGRCHCTYHHCRLSELKFTCFIFISSPIIILKFSKYNKCELNLIHSTR